MSGWDVAGIIIAVFWAILVSFLAYALVHLARVLRETAVLVSSVTEQTVPLLTEARTTVVQTNAQLAKVDTITSSVENVTVQASNLASLFGATLGNPLVKTAALAYGLRKALRSRQAAAGRRSGRG